MVMKKCEFCDGEGEVPVYMVKKRLNPEEISSQTLTICPRCVGKGKVPVGKVIRVSEELFKRVSRFGVAGDSMATALDHAMTLAERKRMTDEVNEFDNAHKAS
jgi:RecJ-like exonuclease